MKETQPEEVQRQETEIDCDYNLIHSPYNPVDDYLDPSLEATPTTKKQPMVHDPLPRYLIDLKSLSGAKASGLPTTKGTPSKNPASEVTPKQSSSSSTGSSSEDEDRRTGAVEKQADKEYLEQMQMEYKGTESTQEDMRGVPQVYHTIPHMEEDQLLRGEVMEAFPRTESTLLADTTPGASEAMPPATRDKATAAPETVNQDMLTVEEFMSMPDLEPAQTEGEEDLEESLASFDAMSHQMPSLPTPKENKPPERIEWSPAKKSKKSKKGGKGGRCWGFKFARIG